MVVRLHAPLRALHLLQDKDPENVYKPRARAELKQLTVKEIQQPKEASSRPSPDRGPRVSVIIPCRNEVNTIGPTLDSILRQKPYDAFPIEQWVEVLVVNDASTDGTDRVLAEYAQKHAVVQVVANETRLGLAGSYNRAIRQARAPILLTCHADCRLQGDEYLQRMIGHFSDDRVAAVTGKPVCPDFTKLTFAEKTYILTHLMDIEEEPPMLREINFTEGRCDGFRRQALEAVGLYNEKTRISGEDQILATELRKRGYRLLQDTSLRYHLSVGSSQNNAWRIILRQIVLGQGQAFILMRTGFDNSRLAVTAPNRFRRRRLRMLQVAAVPLCLIALAVLAAVSPLWFARGLLGLVALRLGYLFLESHGRFFLTETLRIFPIAVACDLTYCLGFYRGLLLSLLGRSV